MIIAKNNKITSDIWAGQTIDSSAEYTLQSIDVPIWKDNLKVNQDILSGDLIISDGITYFTNYVQALDYLKGSTISSKVISLPNAMPFAEPIYRTKRNAIASTDVCNPGESKESLFFISQELYATGGCVIIKNAKIGDYLKAEIKDVNGVIPDAYRPAICEAWPIVATYVIKEFVEIWGEIYTVHKLDTRPLAAKITTGLFLSLTYFATNEGVQREFAANYYLNKKL